MGPRAIVRSWLCWWAAMTVLWWLLVFKTQPAELVAGALAGAVAASAVELVRVSGSTRFAFRAAWLRCLLSLPREVLVETAWMIRVLWRALAHGERIQGVMRAVPFAGARTDTPEGAGRRAVAKWRGSVSANTFVLGFAEEADAALIHQLVATAEPPRLDPDPGGEASPPG